MEKEHVLGVVEDLVSDFLYYDRKGDELSSAMLVELIDSGVITAAEIVVVFECRLNAGLAQLGKDAMERG